MAHVGKLVGQIAVSDLTGPLPPIDVAGVAEASVRGLCTGFARLSQATLTGTYAVDAFDSVLRAMRTSEAVLVFPNLPRKIKKALTSRCRLSPKQRAIRRRFTYPITFEGV